MLIFCSVLGFCPYKIGFKSNECMKYIFETKMEVRDYECDIEGIVNNANYLHYMEHTRHLFLQKRGLSFAEMHRKGVDAVVARMNLQYKTPLQCDDEFISPLAGEAGSEIHLPPRHLPCLRRATLPPRHSGAGVPHQWQARQ